jgi:hypothetical protein
MFSVSNTATAATKRAVRVMQYRCRVALAAVSEYAVTGSMRVPPLALVPAPRVLTGEAWDALGTWARRGGVVLVTGPLEPLERLGPAHPGGPPGLGTVRIPMGRGVLLWSPQPVELSSDEETVAAVYRWALGEASIEPPFTAVGAGPGVLIHAAVYQRAVLFTLVSETDQAESVRLVHVESGATLEPPLRPGRAAMLLVERRSGRVLARYPGA